jgi:cytochrome b6-f complex iron-sulfur subunit
MEGQFGGTVAAGAVDTFPVGSVTHFPDGRFYLVRADDAGFLAIYQRCTHLGCAVDWEPDKHRFFCPCHASSFDQRGDVDNPPAPRALDTFAIVIEDGHVLVNTADIQTRTEFLPDQLVYA